MTEQHGGNIIGEILASRGVEYLFTLCGGHISPILVGAKAHGIRVVDVRDEVNAVFAADAVARMTGIPGVAAVTAGPGVTNTITAVKNAQMAQTPLVLFGGATATLLKGRGALQDIDQLSMMRPITKWATSCKTVASLKPTLERALELASSGVPGPVFIEVPVDLLYPEAMVKEIFLKEAGLKGAKNLGSKALELVIRGYLFRQFNQPHVPINLPFGNSSSPAKEATLTATGEQLSQVAELIERAERPVLVMGSQALVGVEDAPALAAAVQQLGIPTFLGGMSRGLLGRNSDIQFRHKRGNALKEADLVLVAGFPFDFRLSYGRAITSKAKVVAINLSTEELKKNRRPEVAIQTHAGKFLEALSKRTQRAEGRFQPWFETLRAREAARDAEIQRQAVPGKELINPLHFFVRLEEKMAEDAVLVVDGGDFVATASYIVRPRAPLSWLDPGAFGTLGVGGGFAAGASLVKPGKEVWLIYGDGSSAYSLAEFDTYVRHGLAPIAVIGTDAVWAQIAREQSEMLGDDVGTTLRRTDYHRVAEGYGGVGLLLDDSSRIDETLEEAKRISRSGKPVCINVQIAATDFRKGSISM